jgi:hypothetical protein
MSTGRPALPSEHMLLLTPACTSCRYSPSIRGNHSQLIAFVSTDRNQRTRIYLLSSPVSLITLLLPFPHRPSILIFPSPNPIQSFPSPFPRPTPPLSPSQSALQAQAPNISIAADAAGTKSRWSAPRPEETVVQVVEQVNKKGKRKQAHLILGEIGGVVYAIWDGGGLRGVE